MASMYGSTDRSTPAIRLRMEVLDPRLESLGYKSDAAKSEFLELSPATFSRLRSGRQRPGNRVIAKIRSKLPRLAYEQLFEEVTGSPAGEVRA